MDLVQTHKCLLLIMGPHVFQIKLSSLNSSVCATWSEIQFEVHQLTKLTEEESLPKWVC
jgi:hypothetical protein